MRVGSLAVLHGKVLLVCVWTTVNVSGFVLVGNCKHQASTFLPQFEKGEGWMLSECYINGDGKLVCLDRCEDSTTMQLCPDTEC